MDRIAVAGDLGEQLDVSMRDGPGTPCDGADLWAGHDGRRCWSQLPQPFPGVFTMQPLSRGGSRWSHDCAPAAVADLGDRVEVGWRWAMLVASRNRHVVVMTWRVVGARLDAVTITDQQIRPDAAGDRAGATFRGTGARSDA